MMSASRSASSASSSASSVSLRRRMRLGDAAVRRDDRAEREAIDVVDLARRERRARVDDFVAGRENRHARLRVHRRRSAQPDRGERADAARRSARRRRATTSRRRDVGAPAADVLAGRRPATRSCTWSSPTGACLLDHHHRVGARRASARRSRSRRTCPAHDGVVDVCPV